MTYLLQIIIGLSLIFVIVLQSKGTGLGSSWGGNGASYHSKRGLEKMLFYLTIVLSILFVLVAFFNAL